MREAKPSVQNLHLDILNKALGQQAAPGSRKQAGRNRLSADGGQGMFRMTTALDELRWAIATKLAQLLEDDEVGWRQAASSIDTGALEKGIDLEADFKSPRSFSDSVVDGLHFHTDFEQRFPNGVSDLERFEVAEELFSHLMPRHETDYSAFEPERPTGVRHLLQNLMRILNPQVRRTQS